MTSVPAYARPVAADTTPWIRCPEPSGWTTADLHALPDDGLRYELIDGSLIVSPSATSGHNLIARWIAQVMEAAAPTDEWIVSTDQSTTIDNRNEPRPDIVVANVKHISRSPFPITDTLLVAEVVSPTSVLRDTETKKGLYARAGVPAYWIVVPDTDTRTISLTELRLDHGTYRHETHDPDALFATAYPWPLTINLPGLSARWASMLDLAQRDG
jgi:Uma2 family endonuclease